MTDMDGASANNANVPGGQQHSSDSADAQQLISALQEQVTTLSKQVSALQGDKDRGVHQASKTAQQAKEQADLLQSKIDELTSAQAYLEKYGNPAEAARQKLFDDMIRQGGGQKGATDAGAGKVGSASQADLQAEVDKELIELLGVDTSGTQYLEALGQGLSPIDAAKMVAKANQGASTDPNTALGITPLGAGGSSSVSAQQDVLMAQYEQEFEEKKKDLQGNPWHVELLKRKYREKGLEIW